MTIRARTYRAKLLVDGNLNSNLEEPEGSPRLEAIADELIVDGLMDMGLHFLPQCKLWSKGICTWRMQQDR